MKCELEHGLHFTGFLLVFSWASGPPDSILPSFTGFSLSLDPIQFKIVKPNELDMNMIERFSLIENGLLN